MLPSGFHPKHRALVTVAKAKFLRKLGNLQPDQLAIEILPSVVGAVPNPDNRQPKPISLTPERYFPLFMTLMHVFHPKKRSLIYCSMKV